MFEFRNVTRRFGSKTAVDNVTLDIPAGQMVGIIGRSGAGKSTLLRMINRLTDPTDGAIHYRGRNVTALSGGDLRESGPVPRQRGDPARVLRLPRRRTALTATPLPASRP